MSNQINFTPHFGRQSRFFKESAVGRRINRELIRDLLKVQRVEAAEKLSDQR